MTCVKFYSLKKYFFAHYANIQIIFTSKALHQ